MSVEQTLLGFGLAPLPLLIPWLFVDPEVFVLMLPVTYGAALLVGIPVHLFLKALRRRDLAAYLAATSLAALTALAAGVAIIIHTPPDPANPFALRALAAEMIWSGTAILLTIIFLMCAWITATLFWWIAVRERPN